MPFQAHPPDRSSLSRARRLGRVMPLLDGLHGALAEALDVPLLSTGVARWSMGTAAAEDGAEDGAEEPADAVGGASPGPTCELLTPPPWATGATRSSDRW